MFRRLFRKDAALQSQTHSQSVIAGCLFALIILSAVALGMAVGSSACHCHCHCHHYGWTPDDCCE